ncbi:MAG: hypothetical protein WCT19_04585 [Candidatus Paceibacterota bacterium]|jgi:hypothetical protein
MMNNALQPASGIPKISQFKDVQVGQVFWALGGKRFERIHPADIGKDKYKHRLRVNAVELIGDGAEKGLAVWFGDNQAVEVVPEIVVTVEPYVAPKNKVPQPFPMTFLDVAVEVRMLALP